MSEENKPVEEQVDENYQEYLEVCKEMKCNPVSYDRNWLEHWGKLGKSVQEISPLQKKYNDVFGGIHKKSKAKEKLTNADYKDYIEILAEIGDPIAELAKADMDKGNDIRNVMFRLCDSYRAKFIEIEGYLDRVNEMIEAQQSTGGFGAPQSPIVDLNGNPITQEEKDEKTGSTEEVSS